MVQMIGVAAAGVWCGWCVLVLREDLAIREGQGRRRIRALLLGFLTAAFMITLALRNFPHFVLFAASMLVTSTLLLTLSKKK